MMFAFNRPKSAAAISAASLPTLYYVPEKAVDRQTALRAVRACLDDLDIIPVDQATLELAYAQAGQKVKARTALEGALALKREFDGSQDARKVLAGLSNRQ